MSIDVVIGVFLGVFKLNQQLIIFSKPCRVDLEFQMRLSPSP